MRNRQYIPELPPPRAITVGGVWPVEEHNGKFYDNHGNELIQVSLEEFLEEIPKAVPGCGCAACECLRKVKPTPPKEAP